MSVLARRPKPIAAEGTVVKLPTAKEASKKALAGQQAMVKEADRLIEWAASTVARQILEACSKGRHGLYINLPSHEDKDMELVMHEGVVQQLRKLGYVVEVGGVGHINLNWQIAEWTTGPRQNKDPGWKDEEIRRTRANDITKSLAKALGMSYRPELDDDED